MLLLIVSVWLLLRRTHARPTSVAGRVVVVTGGASGIGRALALRLARAKALVCVWDLPSQQAAMDETKALVERAGGVCRCFAVDVSDSHQLKQLVALTESEAPIDVFINNAGVAHLAPFLDVSERDVDRTMAVNVLAVMHACAAVLPAMVKRARGGHVVVVGSMMDSLASPNLAAYTASKWAVTGFVESLRQELPDHVHLSLVRPWIVAGTPMFQNAPFFSHWLRYLLPATTPEAVAEAVMRIIVSKEPQVSGECKLW